MHRGSLRWLQSQAISQKLHRIKAVVDVACVLTIALFHPTGARVHECLKLWAVLAQQGDQSLVQALVDVELSRNERLIV